MDELLKILDQLQIKYERVEHKPVYTVAEIKDLDLKIDGTGCKNIFLKDKDKNYFLYVLQEDKRVDFKKLQNQISSKKLSFASEEELNEMLGLKQGAVTPLGVINDTKRSVKVLLDKELKNHKLLLHPNVNTQTISMKYEDLIKLLINNKSKYQEIDN